MKYKINLKRFDVTITQRTDTENYAEGLTVADSIEIGLGKLSWLQPGVTYTSHVLTNAGQVRIPKVTATAGGRTALCVDGNPGNANFEYINCNIDSKVTGVFDGCFTTKTIADRTIQRALNNAKLKRMTLDYEADIHSIIETNATESTILKSNYAGNPVGYLNALKTEYYKLNSYWPTYVKVSLDFWNELLDAKVNLSTPLGDEAFVTGNVGRVSNLLVIPDNNLVDRDAILGVPEAINIATPTEANQVAGMYDILGAYDNSSVGFENGILTLPDINALAGVVRTYVHKAYGRVVVPELTLITPVIV